MNLKVLITAAAVFASLQAEAKKLLIVTDQASGSKARQIRSHILGTLPFSLLKSTEFAIETRLLDKRVTPIKCRPKTVKYTKQEIQSLEYWAKQNGIVLTKKELDRYRKGYTIDRLVECETGVLAGIGVQHQADYVMFVHDSPYEGGSGGDIPIILSGSRVGIGLHEWLHGFGFADEYAYTREEAALYCQRRDWPNVAIFNDRPPYYGAEDVRFRHRDQIAWLPYLGPKAELTTGTNLGSPKFGNLGLFRSQTCDQVQPVLKSWKPTGHATVLGNPHTNYIPKPYWPTILSNLGVSSARINQLMKSSVTPKWDMSETSPGSPPAMH